MLMIHIVCSSKNTSFVKDLGADEVIDYTTSSITQTLLANSHTHGKSDLLIDCVGGTELISSYVRLLSPLFPSSLPSIPLNPVSRPQHQRSVTQTNTQFLAFNTPPPRRIPNHSRSQNLTLHARWSSNISLLSKTDPLVHTRSFVRSTVRKYIVPYFLLES